MLPDGAAILGIIGYGAARPPHYAADGPFAEVGMDAVDGGPCYEAWASALPATWDEANGVTFAVAGPALFGTMRADSPSGSGMEAEAYDIYARLFALADRTGHRHVIRVFNYIADITGDADGMERYRRFNAGRHDAFNAFGRAVEAAPAACALGMRAGPTVVAFLASSEAGQPVENPRQVSAYRYPATHSPRSPSFSRAMLTGGDDGRALHISGTASIVGHESVHVGDVAAQTAEIVRNFGALLGQCGALTLADVQSRLLLKIYVRHPCHAPAIRRQLALLGNAGQSMIVQADICRKELLVEIEAFCMLPESSG